MITSVKLMLNKSRILNNGSYPLVFQVIHNRRKKLLYTGYRMKEEVFVNPEKPDVPLNKNDAFQKVQKRRVQEKR